MNNISVEMNWTNPIDGLHSDSENYDIYCDRCKRVHKYYTMTREQYQKIISDGAKKMAKIMDKQIIENILRVV